MEIDLRFAPGLPPGWHRPVRSGFFGHFLKKVIQVVPFLFGSGNLNASCFLADLLASRYRISVVQKCITLEAGPLRCSDNPQTFTSSWQTWWLIVGMSPEMVSGPKVHEPSGGPASVQKPLSSEYGTCKTVKARFQPWLAG